MKKEHDTAHEDQRAGGGDAPEIADEVLAVAQAAAKVAVKRAADALYGEVLEAVQDYFCDNLRFNLASRLESAERERRAQWERAERAEATVEELRAVCRKVRHVNAKAAIEGYLKPEEWGDELFACNALISALLKATGSASGEQLSHEQEGK